MPPYRKKKPSQINTVVAVSCKVHKRPDGKELKHRSCSSRLSDGPTGLQCHAHSRCGPSCPCEPRVLWCAAGAEGGCSGDGLWHGYVALSWSVFQYLYEEAGIGCLGVSWPLAYSMKSEFTFHLFWCEKVAGAALWHMENLAGEHQRDAVALSCEGCNSIFYLALFRENALRKIDKGQVKDVYVP